MDAENKSNSNQRLIIILVAVVLIVAIVAVAAVFILRGSSSGDTTTDSTVNIADGAAPRIGYAEGTVALDEDSLSKAVEEMFAKAQEGYFATEYRNDAHSADGQNFECYVGNSNMNTYDMYIQMFADDELTDQVFLSELLRPGTAFDNITLEHPLDPGLTTVYTVFTQVGEEDGNQVIKGQVTVTMDFIVGE